jgi:hypothetical protein
MDKTIFAITCSSTPELLNTKFFLSKESAKKYLKNLADERRNKLGVHCVEENEERFSFVFGWEERSVVFNIVEIKINE